MSALDDRFYQIKRMHGAQGAKIAAESHIAAIDIIESNIQRESIDCDFGMVVASLLVGLLFLHAFFKCVSFS